MTPPHCEEGQCPPGYTAPFAGDCRWLISLDYDGTLRAKEGNPIPPEFLELMMQWRALGVRWGINTGRALPYLLPELVGNGALMPDFICTCERYAYLDTGDRRLRPATELNRRSTLANLALRQRMAPYLHHELRSLRQRHPDLEWVLDPDDPLSIQTPDGDTMDRLMPLLAPLHSRFPDVAAQRAGRYMRFSDARFNKGTALRYVAKCWQVQPSHLVIVGDGHNDLDAFTLFPQAFRAAPQGAHPEVIEYLSRNGGYISGSPGVLEALLHWHDHFLR